jgi:hypothetical protein
LRSSSQVWDETCGEFEERPLSRTAVKALKAAEGWHAGSVEVNRATLHVGGVEYDIDELTWIDKDGRSRFTTNVGVGESVLDSERVACAFQHVVDESDPKAWERGRDDKKVVPYVHTSGSNLVAAIHLLTQA